jgi:hypothetical protein
MHVPKTSGTVLHEVLRKALRPRVALEGFDQSAFGGFRDFATLDPRVRRNIYADRVPSADYIGGHIAAPTILAARPDAQLVTVLREPRSRLLSHWLFWRSQTEADLRPWGAWGAVVRQAREPLADFISRPALAASTDNLALRMLLWSDARIPPDDFIDPRHDDALVAAALARLQTFAFADIVENPNLQANLEGWVGRKLTYPRRNETRFIPPAYRSPLRDELSARAVDLLDRRSRLDRKLWDALAERLVAHEPPNDLCARTFQGNGLRYAALMAS